MKFFVIFFLAFNFFSFSQEKTFDENDAKKEFLEGNHEKIINEYINNSDSYKKDVDRIELIAKCYNKLEDYYKEIEYYEKAIQLNNESFNYKRLVVNYINIAKAYKKIQKKDSYKKSISYLKKALSLNNLAKTDANTKRRIHNNLGNYYGALSKKKEALFHHEKALETALKINDSSKIALSYSNIGLLYLNANSTKEDLNKVSYYIKESLKYNPNPNYAPYLNLGIVYYLKEDYKKSINYYNSAKEVVLNKKTNELNKPIGFQDIKSSNNKEQILNILFEEAYAWIQYAKIENKKELLNEGIKTIKLADQILDILFIEAVEEKTKIYWRLFASDFYFLGVHMSHLLNDTSTAFYFTEKNKAILLLNTTEINKANKKIKLPEATKTEEVEYKKTIYLLENQINFKNNIDSLKNLLFEEKLKYQFFLDSISKTYPDYLNKNIKTNVISIEELQSRITDTNTCYISYIWNKTENQFNVLYGVALTKNEATTFKINNLELFNNKTTNFKKQLSRPLIKSTDISNYQQLAHSLYKDLFPEAIQPLIKGKKLIIIPDSDLQNIPFEALISKKDSNNYLINDNEISYAYSISYLIENNTTKRNPSNTVITIAPESFNYDDLSTLPRSKTEAKVISEVLNGRTLLDEKATKQNFFSQVNNYKIIHLSTHANANDSIAPWIAFKNEKLYLNELYTTNTQADLVVLNACNSSLGKLNQGEGVFSLARGFFYSGSNSVASSLWNVNDKSNTEITISFFNYLKKGNNKSQALRRSKLDYIKNHSLSELSPYYWSNLILIGNTDPIKINNYQWTYYAILVIGLLIVFLVFKKIMQKTSKRG